jgi:very-short-patch-repair endonuclease
VVRRSSLEVTALDDTLVDVWPMLHEPARTGCVLEAVSQRMTLPDRVAAAMGHVSHLRGRAALARLVDRLAQGCRSHLEIFGADRVFTGSEFAGLRRQARVRVDSRTYYLDAYAERERVDFELDGSSWHRGQEQRERDLRRDAALATVGILVVRFTYKRLVSNPDDVQQEASAVLRARRG